MRIMDHACSQQPWYVRHPSGRHLPPAVRAPHSLLFAVSRSVVNACGDDSQTALTARVDFGAVGESARFWRGY
jgi:hypothetical protein